MHKNRNLMQQFEENSYNITIIKKIVIMQERAVVLLLLQLCLGCIVVEMRGCSERVPAICSNVTNIQISKQEDHYRLRLCLGDQCVPGETKWIKCDAMCEACLSISTSTVRCANTERGCERQVVNFLSRYCASNTLSTDTSTCTPTTRYIPLIRTVTVSPTCNSITPNKCTQTSTVSSTYQLSSFSGKQSSEMNRTPLVVLGIFLGLLVIVLLVVSTGFMWIVWTLKKERSEKARLANADVHNTSELYSQNPSYGVNVTAHVSLSQTEATYDVVNLPSKTALGNSTEKGQTNSMIDPKRKTNRQNTTTDGKLGLQEMNIESNNTNMVNNNEMEESDKEHDYHVLEGPEWKNSSGFSGAEIVGGASEYEVPVLQKKLKK